MQQPNDYDHKSIEKKWQAYWLTRKTFKTYDDFSKPKYYILDMFPYPSGDGLHVGHPEGYTATDILARFKRMKGFNVLHPMGWDAFGLPAEQFAIQVGTHPKDTTQKNINRFREQIRSLGFSYDWDREIDTTDPKFYKWTQWIFLQLFKRGLAYESFEPVNWCPALGTVLANEEVINGKSERGDHPVIRRPMRQWVLKITSYAERLLEDLDLVDWPESVKEMQRNWIGKSVGAEIYFSIEGRKGKTLEVFTTRPDTVFGATFCVLAPEHPFVQEIVSDEHRQQVLAYVDAAKQRSDVERKSQTKIKSGVFTGAFAVNPFTAQPIPIFVADYVLINYGKGAIMGVPAHDERDEEFAHMFALPIKKVIDDEGRCFDSGFLNGKKETEAKNAVCDWLEARNCGKKAITYKLKDWLFSRQRYWGEPFPLVRDKDGNVQSISEDELPVCLPELGDFKPSGTGEPPLAKAASWVNFEKEGRTLSRETNTMPQWAGSCWYYLRYLDPHNHKEPWDKTKENYWMPVDLYVGGVEHAVLHLLYARFWHKVLFDAGWVSTREPFHRLVNQGMILGENGEKMSKSRGNVVNPDLLIEEYGADSVRLYEMFMGPLQATKPWQTAGVIGCHRFLRRVWRLLVPETGNLNLRPHVSASLQKALHKTIKKVTEDTESLNFNTAISAMMEFVNLAYKEGGLDQNSMDAFILLLSPYAPHLAEEMWERAGHPKTLAFELWPAYDATQVTDDLVTVSVQVNGKLRGTIQATKEMQKEELLTLAKAEESVSRHLAGKTIVKEIVVPLKIINFVVKE